VLVLRIVVVQVAAAPGALAHLAEGQLAQAAQFQQQRRIGGAGRQQDLLAVGGLAQLGGRGDAGGDLRRRHRRRQRLGACARSGIAGRAIAAQRVQRAAHRQQLCARVTALPSCIGSPMLSRSGRPRRANISRASSAVPAGLNRVEAP
jgi:hypothetical protein